MPNVEATRSPSARLESVDVTALGERVSNIQPAAAEVYRRLQRLPDGRRLATGYMAMLGHGFGPVPRPADDERAFEKVRRMAAMAADVMAAVAGTTPQAVERRRAAMDQFIGLVVEAQRADGALRYSDDDLASLEARTAALVTRLKGDRDTYEGPVDGAREPRPPVAPEAPRYEAGILQLGALQAARKKGDFAGMHAAMQRTVGVLESKAGAVDPKELEAYFDEIEKVAAVAKDKNEWGFWEILLAILTLGIPLIVDALSESDAEKVMDFADSVKMRLARIERERSPDTLVSVFGMAEPQKRRPGETIPGTDMVWDPEQVARMLGDWMGGEYDGTENESRILDITHGLHIDDRIAVAEAYWRQNGQQLKGKEALSALHKKLIDELDDSPFGTTRDGYIIRAQFDPDNRYGQMLPHDMIMLDLDGVFSKNGAAIQRLLQGCSRQQLRAIDLAMREKYHLSLQEACEKLTGEDERRALFLIHAPRVDGSVPDTYIRAFELREAARGLGTDENRLFRQLEAMSAKDFLATAKAYSEVNESLWREDVHGDDGASGEPRATALYRRLFDDLNNAGFASEPWLQRLAFASQGLKYEPDATLSPQARYQQESAHRERVARYIAATARLAGETETDADDVRAVLPLVQPTPGKGEERPENGLPTANEVRSVFGAAYPGHNLRVDFGNVTAGELEELTDVTFDGDGYNSPAAAALRIHNAIDGGFLGLAGTHEEVITEVLDRPELSAAQRAVFVKRVQEVYSKRYGQDLRATLIGKYGAELTLSNGRRIASRVVTLLDNGVLTPAERMVYAIHEPGLFGVFKKTEEDLIMKTAANLSPLEKVVAMSEYARITGRIFNLEAGQNPLMSDLQGLQGRDVRHAQRVMQLMPHEAQDVAFELAAYMNDRTDPVFQKWMQEKGIDAEEWTARNFGDADPRTAGIQRTGFDGFRELVRAAGGPAPFARSVGMSERALIEDVRRLVTDTRGNALGELLMDFFGPEGAGLEQYARQVGAAVRDLELYRRDHEADIADYMANGQYGRAYREKPEVISGFEQRSAAVRRAYEELLTRGWDYGDKLDRRIETFSNVMLTIAIAGTLIVAPEVSPGVLVGIGAVTKAGTHLAFGEQRPLSLLLHAVRGGAAGLLAHFGRVYMGANLTADSSVWQHALHGGIAGGTVRVGHGVVGRGLDGNTWERGLVRGVHGTMKGSFDDFMQGAAMGAASSVAWYYIQKALAPKPEEPAKDPEPPKDDETGPKPGEDGPVDSPTTDTGPGEPDPVDSPTTDTGPGEPDPVGTEPTDIGPGENSDTPSSPSTAGGDNGGPTAPTGTDPVTVTPGDPTVPGAPPAGSGGNGAPDAPASGGGTEGGPSAPAGSTSGAPPSGGDSGAGSGAPPDAPSSGGGTGGGPSAPAGSTAGAPPSGSGGGDAPPDAPSSGGSSSGGPSAPTGSTTGAPPSGGGGDVPPPAPSTGSGDGGGPTPPPSSSPGAPPAAGSGGGAPTAPSAGSGMGGAPPPPSDGLATRNSPALPPTEGPVGISAARARLRAAAATVQGKPAMPASASRATEPVAVTGVPAEIESAREAYRRAVRAGEPTAVLRTLLGFEAFLWLQHFDAGRTVPAAIWADLAGRAGTLQAAPVAEPTTWAKRLALLESLRTAMN